MPTEPNWLSPREDRTWRAFIHAHHRLGVRLNQLQLRDSGLTKADYELLAVLSGHPDGRVPAQEAC
ncbi:MAG: MarR family transcriptional regulator, partial [Trebonia sp.]